MSQPKPRPKYQTHESRIQNAEAEMRWSAQIFAGQRISSYIADCGFSAPTTEIAWRLHVDSALYVFEGLAGSGRAVCRVA